MIRAEFMADKSSGSITMRVTGHAMSAEKGKDLICAIASGYVYQAAQALEFMYEDKELRKKPKMEIESGNAVLSAKPKEGKYVDALHLFFVVQAGFYALAHNFPQFVELKAFGTAE